MRFLPVLLLAATLTACAGPARPVAREPALEFLTPDGPSAFPFVPAVRAGDLLFLSGQIGTDSSGTVVKGGITPETKQTMDNIQRLLSRIGSSMDQVVKCTVFLTDLQEWPAMNVVYKGYFTLTKPARSAIGVDSLVLGARVEIECIAAAGHS